ncbi:MAG: M23 family metallopeptidase [Ruminococcus sp.]|nr:M23 family metallopeptidase [Ruminococcus sp.]
MLIALLPVAGIIFIVLIILAVIAAVFGNEETFYRSYFVLPFDTNTYTITSPYGERTDPINNTTAFHSGIDVVPTSSNIVAVADGTVVISEMQESGGETVVIEHKLGGVLYRTFYHHLKENSRTVKVGDVVTQGQQVGIMGSTGRSTGDHLHFSLQKYNVKDQKFEYTDPSIIINNKVTSKEYSLFDYTDNKFSFPDNDYMKNKLPTPDYQKPTLTP